MLTLINFDAWTSIAIGNIVVDQHSAHKVERLVAIHDDPLAIGNSTGSGSKYVANKILVVVKDIAIHENLGSSIGIAVRPGNADAAAAKRGPK